MQANLSSPQAAMRVATLQLLCTSTDVPSTEDDDDGPALPGPPQLPGSELDSGMLLDVPDCQPAKTVRLSCAPGMCHHVRACCRMAYWHPVGRMHALPRCKGYSTQPENTSDRVPVRWSLAM